MSQSAITILVTDDNEDDRMLLAEMLTENRLGNDIRFLADGQSLMDYLRHTGGYSSEAAPRPGLILLDLYMPMKSGLEALAEIKGDPELQDIPVAVLTGSKSDEDLWRSHDLGISAFIIKPVTFERLVDVVKETEVFNLTITV